MCANPLERDLSLHNQDVVVRLFKPTLEDIAECLLTSHSEALKKFADASGGFPEMFTVGVQIQQLQDVKEMTLDCCVNALGRVQKPRRGAEGGFRRLQRLGLE
jgi:hypothetical protein